MSLNSLFWRGYFLRPADETTKTTLGGRSDFECPNCKPHKLLKIASIEVAEIPEIIRGEALPEAIQSVHSKNLNLALLRHEWMHLTNLIRVPLYYCWHCPIMSQRFSYQIGTNEKLFELLEYGKGAQGDPYTSNDEYPREIQEINLQYFRISKKDQELQSLANEHDLSTRAFVGKHRNHIKRHNLNIPNHQLGGIPLLLQGIPDDINCPKCTQQMFFFVSIGNWYGLKFKWMCGNPFVQILYHICPQCGVVSCEGYTD